MVIRPATAQTPRSYNSSTILLQLKKLKVLGSVLYIAAHPDDENTKLLAWLSNEKLVRTGYLSLTRGDGGQNLIGDEQGIELGLIRTQELLAARRIDGAEQFFSRAYDFGYSKSPDEALRIWNHDKMLYDVVWMIRQFRPDVIICRFPTTGEGGHGHHTASAILAQEAFDAAADSTKFPEQLSNGITVWQARRLFWNTFNFGGTNTQKEDQLKIDVGTYNPLLGESYGEIAARSRSQHKSQGFGVPTQRGSSIEYFKTLKGTIQEKDLLENINTGWSRLGLADIDIQIDKLIASFQPEHPENSWDQLLALQDSLQSLNSNNFWIVQKEKDIHQLLVACSGLYLEATSSNANLVVSDSFHINYTLNSRLNFQWDSATISGFEKNISLHHIKPNINSTYLQQGVVAATTPISNPYWLNIMKENGSFNVASPLQIGMAENPPLKVLFTLYKNGQAFPFEQPVVYKFTDPVKGEIWQPVFVVPPVNIIPDQHLVIHRDNKTNVISFTVTAGRDININQISNRDYDIIAFQKDTLLQLKKGEKAQLKIPAHVGKNVLGLSDGNHYYYQEQIAIHYDHIPAIQYIKPAEVNVQHLQVKTGKGKIGYIEGAGDKVMESLQQMGYDITILHKEDVLNGHLNRFKTIITGVRAYNTNEWLNDAYDTLMRFMKEGGTLLVQYNTSNSIGPLKARIGPYPFNISRNRITDENATVKFTDSSCSLLNRPNKLSASDFKNWIQERSIYHAADWDAHYKTLFSMHDPGEAEDAGSLIYCHFGKGKFIYTGLVFYRELPAGVEGAYKLMANLME